MDKKHHKVKVTFEDEDSEISSEVTGNMNAPQWAYYVMNVADIILDASGICDAVKKALIETIATVEEHDLNEEKVVDETFNKLSEIITMVRNADKKLHKLNNGLRALKEGGDPFEEGEPFSEEEANRMIREAGLSGKAFELDSSSPEAFEKSIERVTEHIRQSGKKEISRRAMKSMAEHQLKDMKGREPN